MGRKNTGRIRYIEMHRAHLNKEKSKRRVANKNARRARRINRNK